MRITHPQRWQRFGGQWLLICTLTKLAEVLLDGVAGLMISAAGGALALPSLLGFRLISGALGGFGQWWVLQSWASVGRLWVLATSLGSAIALAWVNGLWHLTASPAPAGIMGMMMPPQSSLPQVLFDGLTGLVLGIAQGLVLRPKRSQAGGWIVASVVGFVASSLCLSGGQRLLGMTGLEVSQSA